MKNFIRPSLTLVGAGPGDPELITLKGILALNKADVVLYDALIDKTLLQHVSKRCLTIFVGKKNGSRENSQEQTNQLIVQYALEYGNVVRLKGGDPFVFGRGAEEIDFAERHGIPTFIVPGITSSIAVPACHGIPVTKRGIAESFWVITGTTSSGQLSWDLQLAVQSTATVVVLMATRKLGEIVSLYKSNGKSNASIALIQNGTTDQEKVVAGTIEDIEQKVLLSGIGSPAVIVIGEVVKESLPLKKFYKEMAAYQLS